MGQSQTQLKQSEDYSLVEELPVGNIVKHNKTECLHFLKEYSFTAQDTYQNALNAHSLKLSSKNQHLLNFLHFTTKSENSFCSAFYKIILIFEYSDYSLQKQICNRARDHRPFSQKQIWSVLCSCVLAAVHIVNTQGKMHCGLTPKDIRLNTTGCVKLLNQQMVGIDPAHNQTEGHPKVLAVSLLECMLLQKLNNDDDTYLQGIIERLQFSRDMKEILSIMIKPQTKFNQLEEHLFKLVQDDESLASQSNTPILKGQSPINSGYKCPRILRNDQIIRESQVGKNNQQLLQPCTNDSEDGKSFLFTFQSIQNEVENPDEIQDEEGKEENRSSRHSPEKINSFFLKERQFQPNSRFQTKNQISRSKVQNVQLASIENSRNKFINQSNNLLEINNLSLKQPSITKGQQNLFTDPKLFSLIKNDLEELKMRRSTGELAKYSRVKVEEKVLHNQQPVQSDIQHQIYQQDFFKNLTTQQSVPKIPVNPQKCEKQQVTKQSTYLIKSRTQTHIETTEIIQTKPANKQQQNVQKPQQKCIDNIMDDPDQGFKKKKPSTHRIEQEKQQVTNINDLKTTNNRQTFKQQPKVPETKNKIQTKETKKQNKMDSQYFYEYSNTNSQSSSLKETMRQQESSQKEKQQQKLTYVNEKYTRGRYEGTKLNGKRHGTGTFFYIEGGKYVGNWRQNKMHGKGVLYYPNQQVAYQGQWENDQLAGYGVLYNEDVTILQRPYDYKDWSDVEEYWVKYQGQFSKDNKEGHGALYLSNGEKFEGEFHDDKVDGEGILFRDGSSVRGKWKNNKLVRIF